MSENVKPNSLQAWILAARPKTLTAASIPVMIGCALAEAHGIFMPYLPSFVSCSPF